MELAILFVGFVIAPLIAGAFATRKLGAVWGAALIGLMFAAVGAAIDPMLAPLGGLLAFGMAALSGNNWAPLHAVGRMMSTRRRP